MKTIHKVNVRCGFTQIPNSLLRNRTLSFKARGILCFMLSHREDWEMTLKELEDQGLEGREALRSAVHELESAGYATRKQSYNPDRTFAGVVWTWYGEPIPVSQRTKPTDGFPSVGTPTDGFPSAGSPSEIKNTMVQNTMGTEEGLVRDNKRKGAWDLPPTSLTQMPTIGW